MGQLWLDLADHADETKENIDDEVFRLQQIEASH